MVGSDAVSSLLDAVPKLLNSLLPLLNGDTISQLVNDLTGILTTDFLNDIGTVISAIPGLVNAIVPIFTGDTLTTLVQNIIPLIKAVVAVCLSLYVLWRIIANLYSAVAAIADQYFGIYMSRAELRLVFGCWRC